MAIKESGILLLGLAAVIAFVPAVAQAPDCTGISDVSDYDGSNVSDFVGQLTAIQVSPTLFLRPVFLVSPPGDTERLFIVEQDGLIRIMRDGVANPLPFLDVTAITHSPIDGGGNEEGLLGLAFHPEYATNGWFFIYYTNVTGSQQIVARYTVSGNPDFANPGSQAQVIAIDHPSYDNQDGGMLAFSPIDGYLYIGSGDGGGLCDPGGNSQKLSSNLGKLLRLNVDSLPPSTAGNPFDGATPGNDEIWAYGLRNPWRFSFDRLDGKLFIGDVGEDIWEEIDCQLATSTGGENYGWNNFEGPACPVTSPSCTTPSGTCSVPGYVSPTRYFDQTTAGYSCSVIGGYVYRGCRMSDLHGTYFYSDYCSAMVNTYRTTDNSCVTDPPGPTVLGDIFRALDLVPPGAMNLVTSLGEDEQGELYVLDRTGKIFKIAPTLSIIELSAINAPPLRIAADGSMNWEDLHDTSDHPITSYKVYRSSNANGTFVCVHQSPGQSWIGGDPAVPSLGGVFYYQVTALDAVAGEETRAGNTSDGAARNVDYNSTCP